MAEPAGPVTQRDAETRYYLRVTLIVLAGLVAGGALAWAPLGLSAWRWVPLALVYLVGGYPIAVDGWRELRDHRRLSIDFLMGAAAAGAALIGNPFEGGVLIFLFSLSKTLELFAMARTRSAVARLMDLTPKLATLVDAEGRETGRIPVGQLEPGQMILVRPGERISADGVVRSGGSGRRSRASRCPCASRPGTPCTPARSRRAGRWWWT
jgi:cation transport ATPase